MRVISWNCHDGFSRKSDALLAMLPDIVVLSEVKKSHLDTMKPMPSCSFAGPDGKKGVAVLGFNDWAIEQVVPVERQWFLPVVASRGNTRVNILAVWVIPETDYVGPTLKEIERLHDFISGERVIVTGDFNQSVVFDKGRKDRRKFSTALQQLHGLGLRSIWHYAKNEEHGLESASSLYFRYDKAKGYHIDYAFASRQLLELVSDVSLGSHDEWVKSRLSDHVPLSFSIQLL